MADTLPFAVEVPGRSQVPRILVVDDEERILNFVARALRAEGFAVDVAPDADRAVELAVELPYDLLILDLMMPGTGGLCVLQEVIARRPQQHVLVLSALKDVDSKVTAFNLGADDYLSKPFSLEELLARVRARVRIGRRYERSAAVAEAGPGPAPSERVTIDVDRQEADAGLGPVPLTRREFLLLRELAASTGRTVSKQRLLSSVWGLSHDPGSNVLDVTVRRLRAKLGDDMITTVRGEGYRIDPAE